jgi:NAD(P)-dependent dehydrogenase (short-subunit alcohol dehydrogenase family)
MTLQIDYSGKCIFVTDATSGLGRRIAEGFHRLGATVAINGNSEPLVQETIRDMGGDSHLVPAPADLTKPPEMRSAAARAIARMTRLDVLICCTARGDLCRIDEVTSEYWETMLSINLKSAFFVAQACAPALKKSKGCIVNVASVIGLLGGPPGAAVYATAKGAMVHLSRMMALELAADGVRVNTLCPGWVDPIVPTLGDGSESLNAYIAQRSPLRRTATMEECSDAVVYLASPAASYTNGTALIADGGLTSGHYLS